MRRYLAEDILGQNLKLIIKTHPYQYGDNYYILRLNPSPEQLQTELQFIESLKETIGLNPVFYDEKSHNASFDDFSKLQAFLDALFSNHLISETEHILHSSDIDQHIQDFKHAESIIETTSPAQNEALQSAAEPSVEDLLEQFSENPITIFSTIAAINHLKIADEESFVNICQQHQLTEQQNQGLSQLHKFYCGQANMERFLRHLGTGLPSIEAQRLALNDICVATILSHDRLTSCSSLDKFAHACALMAFTYDETNQDAYKHFANLVEFIKTPSDTKALDALNIPPGYIAVMARRVLQHDSWNKEEFNELSKDLKSIFKIWADEKLSECTGKLAFSDSDAATTKLLSSMLFSKQEPESIEYIHTLQSPIDSTIILPLAIARKRHRLCQLLFQYRYNGYVEIAPNTTAMELLIQLSGIDPCETVKITLQDAFKYNGVIGINSKSVPMSLRSIDEIQVDSPLSYDLKRFARRPKNSRHDFLKYTSTGITITDFIDKVDPLHWPKWLQRIHERRHTFRTVDQIFEWFQKNVLKPGSPLYEPVLNPLNRPLDDYGIVKQTALFLAALPKLEKMYREASDKKVKDRNNLLIALEQHNDQLLQQVKTANKEGVAKYKDDNFAEALQAYQLALNSLIPLVLVDTPEKDHLDQLQTTYHNLGATHEKLKNYDLAYFHFFLAAKISERIHGKEHDKTTREQSRLENYLTKSSPNLFPTISYPLSDHAYFLMCNYQDFINSYLCDLDHFSHLYAVIPEPLRDMVYHFFVALAPFEINHTRDEFINLCADTPSLPLEQTACWIPMQP